MNDKIIKEGYQPVIQHVNDGYQPTTQPSKNITPPSTGTNIKPAPATDNKR